MNPDILAYMTAWVKLNAAGRVTSWTAAEIVEAFALLPAPAVSFDQWRETLSGKAETPSQVSRDNLYTMSFEDKCAANAAYLAKFEAKKQNAA